MNCCQIKGIEELFNEQLAASEVAEFRKKGPSKTTRLLIEAIKAAGARGLTLLDIGGGVGAVHLELLEGGCASATDVDASQAYLNAAKGEAGRMGLSERVDYRHGNFVELAPQINPVDIVTLDRVICCYPDMHNLVSLSAARAKKLYGLVYPRDTWWLKIGFAVMNFFFRLRKNPFRTFLHPARAVEALVASQGFKRAFYHRTLVWQVILYAR